VTTSSCVECLSNVDCAAQPGKLCSRAGRCVACLQNSDCPLASAPVCLAGACH
jgi:hypothetical protein